MILVMLCFLTACKSVPTKPMILKVESPVKVNYQFLISPQEVEKEYRRINKIKDDSSIDFESISRNSGPIGLISKTEERLGFHYYFDDQCYTVLVEPSNNIESFESLLGHEMTHCFYGQYH